MTTYREDKALHKQERQAPADDVSPRHRAKARKKPWVLMVRANSEHKGLRGFYHLLIGSGEWEDWKRYGSQTAANQAARALMAKYKHLDIEVKLEERG